jgi:hypothetical protein
VESEGAVWEGAALETQTEDLQSGLCIYVFE